MQRRCEKLAGFLCAVLLFSLVGCSNEYDLDNNVDFTMGLGSKGLTLKLGSTEPIYLRNLLKVADSDILDTLKTGEGKSLYYVAKDGKITTSVNVATPNPISIKAISFDFGVSTPITTTIPKGTVLPLANGDAKELKYEISNIDECIKEIHGIIPEKMVLTCNFNTSLNGAKIVSNGAKIQFPNFIKSSQLDANNCLAIETCSSQFGITVDSIYFDTPQKPVDKKISIIGGVKVLGELNLKAESDIPVTPGMKIETKLQLSFNQIQVLGVYGKIDKDINAKSEEINIKKDIPKFLQEKNVKVYVENPTVKLVSTPEKDGWPLPIDFSANIKTKRDNAIKKDIALPSSGHVLFPVNQNYTCYFYEGDKPFDIDGPVVGDKYKVPELCNLFETIPDAVIADVSGNHVKINQNSVHRVMVGKQYKFTIRYAFAIPLEFKANTMIVYTDSIEDLNKDIKKYSADSIRITSMVENKVPLNLVAEAFAYGIDGKKINDITISKDVIKAATNDASTFTNIKLNISCSDKNVFKKVDKIVFKASCVATGSGKLKSSQYIKVNDLRFVLLGQIIGDFN